MHRCGLKGRPPAGARPTSVTWPLSGESARRHARRVRELSEDNRAIPFIGAHHIEPTPFPDVGYTEVVAVALAMRGHLVELPADEPVSLGHFMLVTIFKQMQRLGRHPRTFARVDRRNVRSLGLLDRVGLREEEDDPDDPGLIRPWGEAPPRVRYRKRPEMDSVV